MKLIQDELFSIFKNVHILRMYITSKQANEQTNGKKIFQLYERAFKRKKKKEEKKAKKIKWNSKNAWFLIRIMNL